jgi:hypothetical protein
MRRGSVHQYYVAFTGFMQVLKQVDEFSLTDTFHSATMISTESILLIKRMKEIQ